MGALWGGLTGYGIAATGIISSSVIALAFAGYVQSLIPLPGPALVVGVVVLLSGIAWYGVRESVIFAAIITVLEVGTLVLVILFGLPTVVDLSSVGQSFVPPTSPAALTGILSGGVIAFFAFIGFEDIENMAEETLAPEKTAPRAIFWTLGITVMLYLLLSLIAVSAHDRDAITGSTAPLAVLFEQITGYPGKLVAAMAAIAMINGILVQIVMASRVLYGMSMERLAPSWFSKVSPSRRTPARATFLVAGLILTLALFFPLIRLAEATSLVTLSVFTLVNLSLFSLGRRLGDPLIRRYRWWGLLAAFICAAIAILQILTGVGGGH